MRKALWEAAVATDDRKKGGRMIETVYLLSILNMFWGWQWWILMSVSHPPAWGQTDKQDQVLCSKCTGNTPHWQRWGWRLVKIMPFPAICTWDKWESPCPCQVLLPAITDPLSSSFKPIHCQLFRALSQRLRRNPAPPYCIPWTRLLVRIPPCFSDAACPGDVWRKFFTSLILETAPLFMARADWSLITQDLQLWVVLA